MAAQALVWSVVVTACLVALAWFLRGDMPDLTKLWFRMLIGGVVIAAANQMWWRSRKRDYQGRIKP
jgi:uncharacterized membrane protein YedE/YeeE